MNSYGGRNWSVEARNPAIVTVFGERGHLLGCGLWAIEQEPGAFTAMSPVPMRAHLRQAVVRARNADQLRYVGLRPRAALYLALEGGLPFHWVESETADSLVMLADLEGGIVPRVLIYPKMPHPCAILDANGAVFWQSDYPG